MSAGKLNLVIEQGASFKRTITVTDNTATPVPINLTGSTIVAKAKQRLNSTEFLFSFSITPTDLVNGEFEISLSKIQTSALDFSTAVYDVIINFLDGTSMRLLEGNVVLNKGVSA